MINESMVSKVITYRRKKALVSEKRGNLFFKLFSIFAVIIVLCTTIFGVYIADSNDMYPAVKEGDLVLYYKTLKLMNSDIVIFKGKDGVDIGRIESTSEMTVDVTGDGELTIEGNIQPIQEKQGIFSKTYKSKTKEVKYPVTVNEDEFFILDDNRSDCTDSRDYGKITRDQVKGIVFTIIRQRSF